MSASGNSSRRISRVSLRVTLSDQPGWIIGTKRLPSVGEEVHCTEGTAEVASILGKTGDGSRLLQLRLTARPRQPFFAAASNVLVPPGSPAE